MLVNYSFNVLRCASVVKVPNNLYKPKKNTIFKLCLHFPAVVGGGRGGNRLHESCLC